MENNEYEKAYENAVKIVVVACTLVVPVIVLGTPP